MPTAPCPNLAGCYPTWMFDLNQPPGRVAFHDLHPVGRLTRCGRSITEGPAAAFATRVRLDHARLIGRPCRTCWPTPPA